jgi:cytosine deaminase
MPMFADIVWPVTKQYWLANCRMSACILTDVAVPRTVDAEGVLHADLLVDNGKLARTEPPNRERDDGIEYVDIGGRQVWPTLIDIHTHLDKGHTIDRSPNCDGTFYNARLAAAADRSNWTASDLRRRMEFGLRCAYAHGVSAIRTHIDTYPETAEKSWRVLGELRDEWRGQAVSLCPIDLLVDQFGERVASIVLIQAERLAVLRVRQ